MLHTIHVARNTMLHAHNAMLYEMLYCLQFNAACNVILQAMQCYTQCNVARNEMLHAVQSCNLACNAILHVMQFCT